MSYPDLPYKLYLLRNHLRFGRALTFVARDGKPYQVIRVGLEPDGWPVFVDCPGRLPTGKECEFRWLLDETTFEGLVRQVS